MAIATGPIANINNNNIGSIPLLTPSPPASTINSMAYECVRGIPNQLGSLPVETNNAHYDMRNYATHALSMPPLLENDMQLQRGFVNICNSTSSAVQNDNINEMQAMATMRSAANEGFVESNINNFNCNDNYTPINSTTISSFDTFTSSTATTNVTDTNMDNAS